MNAKGSNEAGSHTPGPWKAGRGDMATIVDVVDSKWIYAGRKYIAIASGREVDWPEVMANARLIAAAPELLEVCKRLRDALERLTVGETALMLAWSPTLQLARAAIADAEGKSHDPTKNTVFSPISH